MTGLLEHLRCQLRHTPAEGLSDVVVVNALLRQAEICQTRMTVVVQHNVVRLQVPVYDLIFVQVFHCQEHLTQVESCRGLVEALLLVEQLAQITVGALVKDEE